MGGQRRQERGRYLYCPNGSHMAMYDDQAAYTQHHPVHSPRAFWPGLRSNPSACGLCGSICHRLTQSLGDNCARPPAGAARHTRRHGLPSAMHLTQPPPPLLPQRTRFAQSSQHAEPSLRVRSRGTSYTRRLGIPSPSRSPARIPLTRTARRPLPPSPCRPRPGFPQPARLAPGPHHASLTQREIHPRR